MLVTGHPPFRDFGTPPLSPFRRAHSRLSLCRTGHHTASAAWIHPDSAHSAHCMLAHTLWHSARPVPWALRRQANGARARRDRRGPRDAIRLLRVVARVALVPRTLPRTPHQATREARYPQVGAPPPVVSPARPCPNTVGRQADSIDRPTKRSCMCGHSCVLDAHK